MLKLARASDSAARLQPERLWRRFDAVAESAADQIAAEAQAEAPALEPVAEVAAEAEPADAVLEAVAAAVVETPVAAPAVQVIAASIPGVSRSLRPAPRPGGAQVVLASAPADPAASQIPVSGDLPVGTKLVQLGAYDSADLARADWTRISGRFSDYMAGKSPVIQQATSGGQTFYRLRADGFADISDARRFCAVLMAENAACIPVVVR